MILLIYYLLLLPVLATGFWLGYCWSAAKLRAAVLDAQVAILSAYEPKWPERPVMLGPDHT